MLLDAAARLKDARRRPAGRAARRPRLGRRRVPRRRSQARLRAAEPVAQHLGPYDRADVVGLMQAADWIVVPSIWWENAPLVIHEARAAGRPVICSGIGGMAELVEDGVTGLHVPPGDAAALAETMQRAAADPGLLGPLARGAAPASHAAFVDAHLGLYQRLRDRVPA